MLLLLVSNPEPSCHTKILTGVPSTSGPGDQDLAGAIAPGKGVFSLWWILNFNVWPYTCHSSLHLPKGKLGLPALGRGSGSPGWLVSDPIRFGGGAGRERPTRPPWWRGEAEAVLTTDTQKLRVAVAGLQAAQARGEDTAEWARSTRATESTSGHGTNFFIRTNLQFGNLHFAICNGDGGGRPKRRSRSL